MTYWIGSLTAVQAAQDAAYALYIAANPTATRDGETIDNPTTAWAYPALTATGEYAVPAYPGMDPPEGCTVAESVEWPTPDET